MFAPCSSVQKQLYTRVAWELTISACPMRLRPFFSCRREHNRFSNSDGRATPQRCFGVRRRLPFRRLSYIYIIETRTAFLLPRDPRQQTARSNIDLTKGSCAPTTPLPPLCDSRAFPRARHPFHRACIPTPDYSRNAEATERCTRHRQYPGRCVTIPAVRESAIPCLTPPHRLDLAVCILYRPLSDTTTSFSHNDMTGL